MAKVDKSYFDNDISYTNGIEAGVELVKNIFELTTFQRYEKFKLTDVASILDRYDFTQLMAIMR